MTELTTLLRCPETGGDLFWRAEDELGTEGASTYKVRNGIVHFLENPGAEQAPPNHNETQAFYEKQGWQADEDGLFGDTKTFVDMRAVPLEHTRKSLKRLGKYFAKGGEVLLDAGSGPIAHDELLEYGEKFDKRICVDLSAQGLSVARGKLGEKGVYLQGDLTRLPLKDNSVDAVTCNHVLYQIPTALQIEAFKEIWRVLKPGGTAVIIYWWSHSPIEWRLGKLLEKFVRDPANGEAVYEAPEGEKPAHFPMSRHEFAAQDWPFDYELDVFRSVSNGFMKRFVSDDWRGRAFLGAFGLLHRIAPGFAGKYGAMPVIILRK